MDVKTSIESGDSIALRRLLTERPARANEIIRRGPNEKNACCPLHYVCDVVFQGTLASGREMPLVEALIEAGADVDFHNGDPLNAAASLLAEDVGIRLLEAGARPELVGPIFGETALHWAANTGLARLVDRLIEKGAPLALKDKKYGATPLAWALHSWTQKPQAGHREVVARLIAAGAKVEPYWLASEQIRADAALLAALRG